MKKITIGPKYESKTDNNPPVGAYETDVSGIKPKIPSYKFNEKVSDYKRPFEYSPEPGQYEGSVSKFGADT